MPTIKKKKDVEVSLKDYIDSKFKALEIYIDIRFTNVEKATTVALLGVEKATSLALDGVKRANDVEKAAMDIRLEAMNKFREALTDQTKRYITRDEHEQLVKQVEELRLFRASLEGVASQKSVYIAYVIAIIGILIGALRWL
jgi:hypothetical protein